MSFSAAGFDANGLLAPLQRLPDAQRYLVGFSGGADSTALLVALDELGDARPAPMEALHFHHGLHADADDWQAHCESLCASRGIAFRYERLEIATAPGSSPETAARNARYEAVRRLLRPGDVFLTAHHADDRAETLFLNLMRGCGLDGLASIPPFRALGEGWVARPLLDFPRRQLETYLAQRGVAWLQDPSNRDTALDRNYLRHVLFPELESRWPGVVGRISGTARQLRETVEVLAADLETRFGELLADRWTMPSPALTEQPRVLQALLVRHWVRSRGLLSPPANRLQDFLDQLAGASATAQVEMRGAGWQLKRHRDHLWLHRHPFSARCPELHWDTAASIDLGPDFGTLQLTGADRPPCELLVASRRPGTAIRLNSDGPRRPVKDLLRESGIPSWLREAVPVLYRGDEVMAVGDWHLAAPFREWLSAHDAAYAWRPEGGLLQKLRDGALAAIIDQPTGLR